MQCGKGKLLSRIVFNRKNSMKKFNFITDDCVCSQSIDIAVDDAGKIQSVKFNGGCPGSLAAVAALVKGKTPPEASGILSGITCGCKNTSCPDQLAKALKKLF